MESRGGHKGVYIGFIGIRLPTQKQQQLSCLKGSNLVSCRDHSKADPCKKVSSALPFGGSLGPRIP